MSFIEDPTRIFRAVRFEKRLGFKMDKQTERSARSVINMDIVSKLAGVRIRDELIYILNENKPFSAVKRLYELGALSKIGINLEISKGFSVDMSKAIRSFKNLMPNLDRKPVKWRLLLAMMFKDNNRRIIESWCLKMKIRRKDIEVITYSANNMAKAQKELKKEIKDDYKLYNIIRKYPPELMAICHSLGGDHAKNIKKYLIKLMNIRLEISGEDLIRLGYRPSPVFKKVLEELFHQKMDGKIAGRENESAAAMKLMEDHRSSAR